MSRYEVPTFAWRLAVAALSAILLLTVLLSGLILLQGMPPAPPQNLLLNATAWTLEHGALDHDHLRLQPVSNTIGVAFYPSDMPTLTLQVQLQIDRAEVAAGLIYAAQDADHFSAFLISPDGYFALSDYAAGHWQFRRDWQTWPHIQRGTTTNRLRVECVAAACTFFINDEWTWHIDDRVAGPVIGLVAYELRPDGGGSARFEQIEMGR